MTGLQYKCNFIKDRETPCLNNYGTLKQFCFFVPRIVHYEITVGMTSVVRNDTIRHLLVGCKLSVGLGE